MESASESSQQQKRKVVSHGLEDQKRVSAELGRLADGAGIAEHDSENPGGRQNVVVIDCTRLLSFWLRRQGIGL